MIKKTNFAKINILSTVLISFFMIGCKSSEEEQKSPPSNSFTYAPVSCSTTTSKTSCSNTTTLTNIPSAYLTAMTKYTTFNTTYGINVCTEDSDKDGTQDYMVVESSNRPKHKSYYWGTTHVLYEAFDFATNLYKYAAAKVAAGYTGTPAAAGPNMIDEECVIMKMPISPAVASTKSIPGMSTMGLALNGVSFFNEVAKSPDIITDELFTFDQCSGHPQDGGTYHYHVDPVCLIRDLGGDVKTSTQTVDGTTYTWLDDNGTNGLLLLGFLMDGFPVYGPVGDNHTDSDNNSTPAIDTYNGHSHSTSEFSSGIWHYHIKTANIGASADPLLWITNSAYYGTPGSVTFGQ